MGKLWWISAFNVLVCGESDLPLIKLEAPTMAGVIPTPIIARETINIAVFWAAVSGRVSAMLPARVSTLTKNGSDHNHYTSQLGTSSTTKFVRNKRDDRYRSNGLGTRQRDTVDIFYELTHSECIHRADKTESCAFRVIEV